jgi:poly(3-hydroxybutyrate) depolymerase
LATGGTDAGGSGGSGGDPDDPWGGLGNPPVKSAGCGTPATLTSGTKHITSAGLDREYIIDIPDNYDPDEPHRLIYAFHGLGGHAVDVSDAWFQYYGLKPLAEAANVPVIFIAPEAIGSWNETDHTMFDDVTDFVKAELCVDTTRVFVTGMSFGGMITYSLSTNHQKRFRAGVAMAPTNFNIYLPEPRVEEPIAWMQSTGMSDGTCPWDSGGGRGAKYIGLEKAADNGCTVPDDIPTWDQSAPSRHICVDMENCKRGYPVKVCTFDGEHIQSPSDEGPGDYRDTPERSWVPAESWDFFMQF